MHGTAGEEDSGQTGSAWWTGSLELASVQVSAYYQGRIDGNLANGYFKSKVVSLGLVLTIGICPSSHLQEPLSRVGVTPYGLVH